MRQLPVKENTMNLTGAATIIMTPAEVATVIRFVSKLGGYECRALFWHCTAGGTARSPISRAEKGLQEVTSVLGLTIL